MSILSYFPATAIFAFAIVAAFIILARLGSKLFKGFDSSSKPNTNSFMGSERSSPPQIEEKNVDAHKTIRLIQGIWVLVMLTQIDGVHGWTVYMFYGTLGQIETTIPVASMIVFFPVVYDILRWYFRGKKD